MLAPESQISCILGNASSWKDSRVRWQEPSPGAVTPLDKPSTPVWEHNDQHTPSTRYLGDLGHCPHASEGLPRGPSLLSERGVLLDQASGHKALSPPESLMQELAKSPRVFFCAKLCGQGCLDEVSFLPRRLTRGLRFSSTPSPLPRPALCGSELWLGKPWVSQVPLLFGPSSDLKCLHR